MKQRGEFSQEVFQEALNLVRSGTFEVRPDGSVWRLKAYGEPCIPRQVGTRLKIGYLALGIYVGRQQSLVYLHRLVWTILNGPIPPGFEINHINGIRDDNRPENLEAVTHSENMRHAREVLCVGAPPPIKYGEDANSAKLTEEQVAEIRRRYAAGGVFQKTLAEEFGVDKETVGVITRGGSWAHLPLAEKSTTKIRQTAKLDADLVRQIRARVAAGERQDLIAAEFGLVKATIHCVVRRRTWAWVD